MLAVHLSPPQAHTHKHTHLCLASRGLKSMCRRSDRRAAFPTRCPAHTDVRYLHLLSPRGPVIVIRAGRGGWGKDEVRLVGVVGVSSWQAEDCFPRHTTPTQANAARTLTGSALAGLPANTNTHTHTHTHIYIHTHIHTPPSAAPPGPALIHTHTHTHTNLPYCTHTPSRDQTKTHTHDHKNAHEREHKTPNAEKYIHTEREREREREREPHTADRRHGDQC